MPTFREPDIQQFELPSSTADDKAIVKVDMTVTGGMAEDAIGDGINARPASGVLAEAIKEWNFTDKTGATIPINQDSVRRLSPEDFTFLSNKLLSKIGLVASARAVSTDEKKD